MRRPVAGESLLHPAALLAVGLLLLNDHWLKVAYHNWWTGKLSDFAGLIFFPLLLQGTVELISRRQSRHLPASCIAATAIVFTAVKLWSAARDTFGWTLGLLQWPLHGQLLPAPGVLDATDLIALPVLAIAWWLSHLSRIKTDQSTIRSRA